MDGHASPAKWPELQEFLGAFQVGFRRPEGRQALERYTTGLLTELPNTNADPMAQAVPGPRAPRVQAFLTTMQWDEEDLNRQRVQQMIAAAGVGDGVLSIADTGFPEQGTASVGVQRQYSGTLGKVGNCQIAVPCGYRDPQATGPVAVRLYLPQTWAYDPERRQQARVPTGISFQTQPEIALQLLDQARAWGVPHRGVVADADYGDQPQFLAGLEARQAPSVVAVRTAFPVRVGSAATSPGWRADELRQRVPRWPWRTVRWRRGTKGWWRQKFVAVHGWRVPSDGHRHAGGPVGERAPQGQPAERQDYWSKLSAETPLAELAGLAHRRHASEQLHEEAKGELGWDQDQGRRWAGFHRHAVTVMLADSFLVWLELRQRHRHLRQGRRGDPFSPSANAPAQGPAGRASCGRPVASTPSAPVVGDDGSVHRPLLSQDLTK
jgi:SRSO17 transposase